MLSVQRWTFMLLPAAGEVVGLLGNVFITLYFIVTYYSELC